MSAVLRTYTTVNSSTEMVVVMSAVSHVIDNKSIRDDTDEQSQSCWVHFHSGKSVHVRTSFNDVLDDLEEYHKTHSQCCV